MLKLLLLLVINMVRRRRRKERIRMICKMMIIGMMPMRIIRLTTKSIIRRILRMI